MGEGVSGLNPVQIRHVREALERRFGDLIDVTDLAGKSESDRQSAFRSRALAALAVQMETGCSDDQAAATVIDGRDDMGIDAVAVSAEGKAPHLWIVQAKWSDRGAAGLGQDAVLKFIRGLNKIFNSEYDLFNSRFQAMASDVDEVLSNPAVGITIISALLGDATIHADVQAIIDEECDKLNYAQPMVDHRVLGLKHFHRAILGDTAEPKIDIEARVDGWNIQREPYEAYYGTIAVAEVANWYEEHGRALFSKNIRDSLDLTEVNAGIIDTLTKSPDHFWYFNNGITVLADSIGKTARFANTPGGPGDFRLVGASVVNGAQTVAAAHRAFKLRPDKAAAGRVLVRLISLENCPEDFGTEVTQKTNTQNQVESRDFATLDQDQHRLREDFKVSLDKRYVIKRGETEPSPSDGCSIVEAAIALACADRRADLAARAKRDVSLLWERETYRLIFGKHPNAYRTWRSVQLLRAVRANLEEAAGDLQGRASAVATYGDLLIAHIAFRKVRMDRIDDPACDWDEELEKAPVVTASAVEWLIHAIDTEFGPTSHVIAACKSGERSQTVVARVLEGMESGQPVPELPEGYRSSTSELSGKRANAVAILVDSGYIPENTQLEFRAGGRPERKALAPWLAANPDFAKATWTSNRSTPLIWAGDGQRYSPSGLVLHMRELATGTRPKAVQGPSRWFWPGKGSLVELAEKARAEEVIDED
ncbi:AIPR family protein [Geodermatophilus sp. URMC 65]